MSKFDQMTGLKVLIFDVDGTLADTECDGHRVAFNRAFEAFKLDWHWDINFYGNLLSIGGGKERIQHFIESYDPPLPSSFEMSDIPKLHRYKNEQYSQILRQGQIPLRPGVLRLIQEARSRGYSMAIATTSSLSNTLALLQYHLGEGAEALFSVIGAGDIVAQKKPAPDIYHYVLDQLQSTPKDCLVFEDSEAGVTAAHQAGLKTIMTLNPYTAAHSQEHATVVVNHLGEPENPCDVLKGTLTRFTGLIDLEVCRQIISLH